MAAVFSQFPVSNLLHEKSRKIVSCHESTPLGKVLEILASENIQSVPIYKSSEDLSGKIFTGIVSVHEILSYGYFHELFDQKTLLSKTDLEASMNKFKQETFFSTPVLKLLADRQEPKPAILSATDSIQELFKLFTHGHHRVLVVAADILIESPVGPLPAESHLYIVSQMDLVVFLYNTSKNKTKLPKEFVDKYFTLPLFDLKKGHQNVIAINDYQPAIAGFNVMHFNNLHAIPVLNKDGKIVSTLSSKDLRGLTVETVHRLLLPVSEYQGLAPGKLIHVFDASESNRKIQDAVEIMVDARLHHVWTTRDNVCCGVVTLTDILGLFV